MKKVILDGAYVDPDQIDPKLHKFIGTFRPAENTLIPKFPAYVLCTCAQILQTREESIEHYNRGHIDSLQYVSIERLRDRSTTP